MEARIDVHLLTLNEPAEWREACIASLEGAPIQLHVLEGIGANDLDVAPGGVFEDFVTLVLCRILLVLGGHAHVLRSAEHRPRLWWA